MMMRLFRDEAAISWINDVIKCLARRGPRSYMTFSYRSGPKSRRILPGICLCESRAQILVNVSILSCEYKNVSQKVSSCTREKI